MRASHRYLLLLMASMIILTEAVCFPIRTEAQSLVQSWSNEPQVAFEWYHPTFQNSDFVALTSVSYLSLSVPVGPKVQINADLPLIYYDLKVYRNNSTFRAGNPYLGVEYNPSNSPLLFDAGLRLLLDNQYDFLNYYLVENTDYYRFASAGNGFWYFNIGMRYLKHLPSGLSFQFRYGTFVMIRANKDVEDQLFMNYGGHLRYRQNHFLVGAGIKGVADLTEDFWNGHNLSHQFYFEIGSPQKNWTPSLSLTFPFDDAVSGEGLNFILGLRVNVRLPAE